MAGYLLDARPYEPYDYYLVQQIISAINGYEGLGVPFNLTQISSTGAAVAVRNLNPLGSSLAVYGSTGDLELVVDSAGAAISDLYVSNDLEVQDALLVHGAATIQTGASISGGNLSLGTSSIIDFDDGYGEKIRLGNAGYGIAIAANQLSLFAPMGASGFVVRDGGPTGTAYKIWTEFNDGHLSGLDADTVDAKHVGTPGQADTIAIYDVDGRVYDSVRLGGSPAASYSLAHPHPYSSDTHDHASLYSALSHNHSGVYEPVHSHPYASSAHTSSADHDSRYVNESGDSPSGTFNWSGSNNFSAGVNVTGASSLTVNSTVLKADDNNVGIGTGAPNASYACTIDKNGAAFGSALLAVGDILVQGAIGGTGDINISGAVKADGNCTLGNSGADTQTLHGTIRIRDTLHLEDSYVGGSWAPGTTWNGYLWIQTDDGMKKVPYMS